MSVAGRKPKPQGEALNRNKTLEFTEVVNVPFDGESPELPEGVDWSSFTRRWWEVIRHLPHAVNWHAGDWIAALECAFVVEQHWQDPTPEMRLREKALGTTTDALRDLRIRYVPRTDPGDAENVTKIDDYRSL